MKRCLHSAAAVLAAGLFLLGCGGEDKPKPKPPKPPKGSGTGAKAPDRVKSADVTAAKVRAAAKRAAAYLAAGQNKDGSYGEPPNFSGMVGVTGLAVVALVESGAAPGGKEGPAVQKALKFMLGHRQPDGGIYVKGKGANTYETAIAIMALAAVDRDKYKEIIAKAKDYIIGIQDDGSKNPLSKGGIGYGSDKTQSNMSTTTYALQALKAAGVKEDDEAWKRAIAFVSMCQNNAETNKLEYAAVVNDGGFIYTPAESKAGKVTVRGKTGWKSYGSMTYAGYLSLVYAKLSPTDERVKGAERWISNNYTLDENPAMGGQGLYYYYHTFALAFAARGEATFKIKGGKEVEWAKDLSAKLLSLQNADGSWRNKTSRWYEASSVICTGYSLRALGKALAQLEKK